MRGLYLTGITTWLGNTTTETDILNYISGNGFNYVAIYSLGSIDWTNTTKKNQIASFINRAKTSYGVTMVGAPGENYDFFKNNIIPFNNSRT
ncbi:MAG: hypothetical protein ACKOQ6_12310, partial [Bacteroidota bacterium]